MTAGPIDPARAAAAIDTPARAATSLPPPAPATPRRHHAHADDVLRLALLLAVAAGLTSFVLLPLATLLWRALVYDDGSWAGLAHFARYLRTPALVGSLQRSLLVASLSSIISVAAAFVFAYALTRSRLPLIGLLRALAMTPLYAPSMLYGIGLIYLFGTQGLISTGLFGHLPWAFDFPLRGPVGIVIALSVLTFPPALVVLVIALQRVDGRLYDAAESIGVSSWRTFVTVTLPACRYGLASAAIIAFVLAFTDFGVPKIVGGNYNVLAVDVYQQVVGQQQFSLGAVACFALLTPTIVAFALKRWLSGAEEAGLDARATPARVRRSPRRDLALGLACTLILLAILTIMITPLLVALVHIWPYSLTDPDRVPGGTWTLRHFRFHSGGASYGAGGLDALTNSLRMAAWTALAGTAFTFLAAYLTERFRPLPGLRRFTHALAVLPLALPGLVLGLAYVFAFNRPQFAGLPNPLHALYGSMALLVICNVIHFHGVSFLTAATAVRHLDHAYEGVAASLGVPWARLFSRVTVPLCLPAIFEVGLYYFVSAMTTVSALIFLYTPDTHPAAVAVIHLDEAGDTQAAAALCAAILAINLAVRLAYEATAVLLLRRRDRDRARRPPAAPASA